MRKPRRDDLIAIGVVGLAAGVYALGDQSSTFRMFFHWPTGGTWSNFVADVISGTIGVFMLWYFRDRIGPLLAAWWGKHQPSQIDGHMENVRAHVTSELVSFEGRMRALMDEHHERILGSINGSGNAGGDH